jgi:hypothetical protein
MQATSTAQNDAPGADHRNNCRSALVQKYGKRAEMRSDRRQQVWVGEGLAVIPVIVRVIPVIGPEGQEMVSGERDCGDGVTCAGP